MVKNLLPLLLGWNSAGISGMAFMQGKPYSSEAYQERVKQTYPEDHEKVLSMDPYSEPEEIAYSATALASDWFIA